MVGVVSVVARDGVGSGPAASLVPPLVPALCGGCGVPGEDRGQGEDPDHCRGDHLAVDALASVGHAALHHPEDVAEIVGGRC